MHIYTATTVYNNMFGFAQFWKKNADKWCYLCIYSLANRGITCCKWLRKPWLRLFPVTCDLSLSLPSKRQKIISAKWATRCSLPGSRWFKTVKHTACVNGLSKCHWSSSLAGLGDNIQSFSAFADPCWCCYWTKSEAEACCQPPG